MRLPRTATPYFILFLLSPCFLYLLALGLLRLANLGAAIELGPHHLARKGAPGAVGILEPGPAALVPDLLIAVEVVPAEAVQATLGAEFIRFERRFMQLPPLERATP